MEVHYRAKCLNEKGEKCVECGAEEEIEVHHVDGNRWNNSLDNLVPLCHECHAKIHQGEPEMEEWIEKIDPEPPGGSPSEEKIISEFERIGIE